MVKQQNEFYEGYKLIKDIKSDQIGLLLKKGSILDIKTIERLNRFQVSIEDYATCIEEPKKSIERKVDQVIQSYQKDFDRMGEGREITDKLEKELLPVIIEMVEEAGIDEIMISVQSKDDYLYRHNVAVSILSAKLAAWLGFSKEKVSRVAFSGLLHDVGKTKIPLAILQKTSRLTHQEFEIMKYHSRFGYDILKSQNLDDDICRATLEHHLREDGTGYPDEKQGHPIHEFAKIIAIADTFHAMTSNRVYRKGLSFYVALKELRRESFGRLNPKMTNTFIKKIMEMSIGNTVRLSDGRKGKITFIPVEDPINPYVQVDGEMIITSTSDIFVEHFLQEIEVVSV
ncbi:HD-GYP domain-containing protein [Halalkalibacter alkalisediminis]|uniref:HD-GYP domain-containing protein n=1 Tax=Halalkalibacter alkalisediminis TaxID=935616 RepID=A0ABV6NEV9_9BACI|nr:HD-GYP domain-containing protein [Halalkalibacter alkalisediminis]